MDTCDHCGHKVPSYNSCSDRHCPKCQALRQAKWIAERKEQADIVRKIFAWHADGGMSIRQIALRLTREGNPTPQGSDQWGETTVHRILHREAYVGILYYNTSMWVSVPSPNGGALRRKRLPRPRSEWIEISIPAIIDQELFERSQMQHGPNQQFSPRNLHEEQWLLRRLLRCGRCGRKCSCVADKRRPHMPPSYYYRCGRSRPPGYNCHPNHIRAIPLDALVWKEIRKHVLNPELLVYAQAKVSESKSLDSTFLSNQIDNAQKRVTRVRAERGRVLDAYQSGFLEKPEFETRAGTVARRLETLEGELETLRHEHQLACEGHDLLERLNEFGSTIRQRLDSMSFEERQKLIRAVVEEVVICGNIVKIYFKIPLPPSSPNNPSPTSPTANRGNGVSGRVGMSRGLNLRSHSGHRRWPRCRWRPLGELQARLPISGQGAIQALSRQIPACLVPSLCQGKSRIQGWMRRAERPTKICRSEKHPLQEGVGRLRQAPLWRTRGCLRLFGPVHSQGRHFQPASHLLGQHRHHLFHQGGRHRYPRAHRVYPPLPDARPPERLHQDPPFRNSRFLQCEHQAPTSKETPRPRQGRRIRIHQFRRNIQRLVARTVAPSRRQATFGLPLLRYRQNETLPYQTRLLRIERCSPEKYFMTILNRTATLIRTRPLSAARENCAICSISQLSIHRSKPSPPSMAPRFHNPAVRSPMIPLSENASHSATTGRFSHTNDTVAA